MSWRYLYQLSNGEAPDWGSTIPDGLSAALQIGDELAIPVPGSPEPAVFEIVSIRYRVVSPNIVKVLTVIRL